MWVAEHWNDYEILDASSGEKLERWGDYILIRPDPQIIWQTPRKNPLWKNPHARYYRSRQGGGHWEFFDLPEVWTVRYAEMTFRLKPFQFKHTGLFPEQAVNWEWIQERIRHARKKQKANHPFRVLNLFAYTGGATLAAASAGAQVTHVDAAKGMVSWARENASASALADAPVRWLVDDCVKFVEREIRRGNTYEGILMDPPSYGRGPKGEIWKMEEQIFSLLEKSVSLLSDEAAFFLLNTYTTGLAPATLAYMLETVLSDRKGKVEASEIGLPVTDAGLILPCGASGRWQSAG